MKDYPRSRIITFRVTEGEYRDIRAMCDGSRNCISEVAREAVMGKTGRTLPGLEQSLACIGRKLDEVLELLHRHSYIEE